MTKRALCIGINDYPGSENDLEGCVNDAEDWRAALETRGFTVTSLLNKQAVKSALVEGLNKIVRDTGAKDIAVITYSGHGTWIPNLESDTDDDEPDGRDEALCPHDAMNGNILVDDEINEIFGQRAYGARIVMISDSCHSGSAAKMLPPMPGIRSDSVKLPKIRFMDNRYIMKDERMVSAVTRARGYKLKSSISASAVLLAGCQDDEYSYDAYFNNRANGAFSYVALRALEKIGAKGTYKMWMNAVKESLPNANYPQTPSLVAAAYQRKWRVLVE